MLVVMGAVMKWKWQLVTRMKGMEALVSVVPTVMKMKKRRVWKKIGTQVNEGMNFLLLVSNTVTQLQTVASLSCRSHRLPASLQRRRGGVSSCTVLLCQPVVSRGWWSSGESELGRVKCSGVPRC